MLFANEIINRINNNQYNMIQTYLQYYYSRIMEEFNDINNEKYRTTYNIYSKFYTANIENILYLAHINDLDVIGNKDIIVLYTYIINQLNAEIDKEVKNMNRDEYLCELYSIGAYQAEFHGRVTMILNEVNTEYININPLESEILDFVNKHKTSRHIISSCIASDKNGIQFLIEKCMYTNFEGSLNKEFTIPIFINVYLKSMVIISLIAERDLLISDLIKKPILRIRNYNIQRSFQDFNDLYKEYNDEVSKMVLDCPNEILSKLSYNLFKTCGFRLETIEKFISCKSKTIEDKDIVNIVEKEVLLKALCKDAECDIEEASNIVKFFTINNTDNQDVFKSIEMSSNRIFEKVFINMNFANINMYLFSYSLLMYSIEILRRKLIYNIIPECKAKNSKIIEKYVKNELVKQTSMIFKQYTDKMILNAHKIEISQIGKIILSNEVDLLVVVNKIMFIVECKDIYYKFTPYGFKADIEKTYKFIDKMQNKICSVLKNKEKLEVVFDCKIESIKPLIVFKTYNMSINTHFKFDNVEITYLNKLDEWINNNYLI